MKRPSLFTNHRLDQNPVARNVRSVAVALLISVTFAACSDDEETSPFVGAYSVTETDEYDEEENYSINIKKPGNGYEITNFGDVMNVPVKVNIKGKSFTVPAQTFVGKTMTIVVSGHGTFDDAGGLQFDYSIDTGDDIILEYTCVATKEPQ